jgi:hypothetical protein
VTEDAWLVGAGVRGGLNDEKGGRIPGDGGALRRDEILIIVGLLSDAIVVSRCVESSDVGVSMLGCWFGFK